MAEFRFGQAINLALSEALRSDPAVVLLGEDIAGAGGAFGVTRNLLAEFGPDRVRDTPISEAAIAGTAVGAAMCGLKPVLELMFLDFVTLAMDALVNQAAKARFMFGGQFTVPLVVRAPHGGGIGAGPQHSQCLEAWLAHVPGLKVVCPATIEDAYGLTRAAIADPDPVIVVENKALYPMRGPAPAAWEETPIGVARIARSGAHITIVTYGAMLARVEAAADILAGEGIEAEVIDLRSLQPWDETAVLESLRRTHRLMVCHEAVAPFGIGAEIVARMVELGFDEWDAPPARVCAPFMPPPFAPELEHQFVPRVDQIVAGARKALL